MEKYTVMNQIGTGTFGSVVKAVSKKTGQLVAIKKMKQKYYTWEECVKLPEVDVIRKIHGHPNIVKLREVIRENNELFFVFEFLDGDLLSVIKEAKQQQKCQPASSNRPAIPYPRIKNYMWQILQSLAYIHKRGYFHRDLKPENLLIRREGNGEILKLADFGLVKEIRAKLPFTDYVSTRWYRAPELLLQDKSYNAPVDVWAAGCIMAELITTNPIFPGTNEVDQLFKIMSVFGSPTETTWPYGLALAKKIRYCFPSVAGIGLKKVLPTHVPLQVLDLLSNMLIYDPKARLTAEQCLQHPFFSVGIDEANGPSTAMLNQLAQATQRLHGSPQSAPAALNMNGVPIFEHPQSKLSVGDGSTTAIAGGPMNLRDSSPNNAFHICGMTLANGRQPGENVRDHGGSPKNVDNETLLCTASPLLLTDLPIGEAKANSPNTTTLSDMAPNASSPNNSPIVNRIKKMNLANLKHQPTRKISGEKIAKSPLNQLNNGTVLSNESKHLTGMTLKNASFVTPPLKELTEPSKEGVKETVNLDCLMEEFASEISGLGLKPQKNTHSVGGKLGPMSPLCHDPVMALLKNSKYKATKPGNKVGEASPLSVSLRKNPASPKGDYFKGTASPNSKLNLPCQSVSPSIRALLAKHKAGHFSHS